MAEVGLFWGQRVELINGEIHVMSPQNDPHASAIMHLTHVLARRVPEDFRVRVQLPLAISDISEPEPDIAIIKLEPGVIRNRSGCPTTAKLVIEVADTSLSRDVKKADAYASAAVSEYWILDLQGERLHVYRKPVSNPGEAGGAQYQEVRVLSSSDSIEPQFVPVASLRVSDLLTAL